MNSIAVKSIAFSSLQRFRYNKHIPLPKPFGIGIGGMMLCHLTYRKTL